MEVGRLSSAKSWGRVDEVLSLSRMGYNPLILRVRVKAGSAAVSRYLKVCCTVNMRYNDI